MCSSKREQVVKVDNNQREGHAPKIFTILGGRWRFPLSHDYLTIVVVDFTYITINTENICNPIGVHPFCKQSLGSWKNEQYLNAKNG